MFRALLMCFVLFSGGLGSAHAESGTEAQVQFDAGMALGKAGELEAAYPLIRQAAEAGLAQAQFTLGTMYTHGQGVAQSKATAREWYHKAAAQDNAEAIYNIGLHYDQGLEIEPDIVMALAYYERASALAYHMASYNAGHIYFMGEGVPEDMAKGVAYFQKAANDKLPEGNLALGWAYEFGLGIEKNYTSAYTQYTFAEWNGKPFASLFKADLLVKMNEEAVALLDAGQGREALKLFDQGCNNTSGFACYNAGVIRLEGRHGIAKDIPKALTQLRSACISKAAYGCRGHSVAVLFLPGTPHKVDVEIAAETIKQECENGDQSQCMNLAYMKYYTRFGMGDAEEALGLLARACYNHGYKKACGPHMELYNAKIAQDPLPQTPRKRGAFEQALHNGLDALAGGLKVWGEAAAAGSGSYTYGNYGSSGPSTTYTQMDTYRAQQDQRDFNNFLQRVDTYGSAYAAGCRPGNPYC